MAEIRKVTTKTLKDYFSWLRENLKLISQFWKKPKEGLVVIPSTEKEEELKEKIKEVFSDEVKIEPKDKTSGIITPIFRKGEGEKYLYILVPLKY
jgi:vacuolar-type H+-ATPase subunit E/Vma4